VGWVEIHPENYVGRGGRFRDVLERAAERWPIVTHGLTMGFGSAERYDRRRAAELRALLDELRVPWHSDHLCLGPADGVHTLDLLPIPYTRASIGAVVDRVREMQDVLGRPVAVEHLSAYASHGCDEMTEADFLAEVLERADARLLLDVNNLVVNAHNGGMPVDAWLARVPVERTIQIHVAGHTVRNDGQRIDTHASPVDAETWGVLGAVLTRVGPRPVLIERDARFPPLDHLLEEVRRASDLLAAAAPRAVPNPCAARRSADRVDGTDLGHAARAVERVTFGSAADRWIAELGGSPTGWRLYRSLVRARVRRVVRDALPRSTEALGPVRLRGALASWLSEAPPQTPLLRELPLLFAAHLGETLRRDADPAVAWLGDLLELERTAWLVRDLPVADVAPDTVLSFDEPPRLAPAMRILSLRHAVHREALPPAATPTTLCVLRAGGNVRVLALDDVGAALLRELEGGNVSIADASRRAASRLRIPVDATLAERLGGIVASWLDVGLLVHASPMA
jgi:hypothetical protein